jgi:hypothetical protein
MVFLDVVLGTVLAKPVRLIAQWRAQPRCIFVGGYPGSDDEFKVA